MEWYGLKHMGRDKHHYLGLRNSNFCECGEDFWEVPRIDQWGRSANASYDVDRTIKIMMNKIPPSTRTSRFFRRVNKNNGTLFANVHLGKHEICDYMRAPFKRMGILNWKKIHPHVFQKICITKMNDPRVNISETMADSCHSSVSTSVVY